VPPRLPPWPLLRENEFSRERIQVADKRVVRTAAIGPQLQESADYGGESTVPP